MKNSKNLKDEFYIKNLLGKIKNNGGDIDEISEKLISYFASKPGKLNNDPRFFGWIMGGGLPSSKVGSIIGTILNLNAGVGNNKVREIDEFVVNWCKEIFHFPENSAGLLTSGGSMANSIPLQSAVHHYRNKPENKNKQIRVYVSEQTHGSSAKAVGHIIDLENVIKIPTDDKFHIDIKALEEQIQKDIEQGFVPAVLVGTIGTTNTGTIDPLEELIKIKEKHNLWLHVDGAYGGPIILTKEFKYLNSLFPLNLIVLHWIFINF